MEKISFCTNSDLEKLQKFIHEKWKKNHVLAVNKKLIDFQHKSQSGYNFVISKNDNDEITAILGFIPLSHFDENLNRVTDIWLAIWKVDATIAAYGIGFSLLKWLEKQIQPQSIGSIGINTEVKKIYDILGYNTGVLNQYYIINPFIQEYSIAEYIKIRKSVKSKSSSFSVVKEIDIDALQHLRFHNNPVKGLKFIENRYIKHPVYNYLLFGIYKSNSLKAVLVVRKIKINQSSCLRIVDIQGSYSDIGFIREPLINILQKHNSEYIDCLNHGIAEKMFFAWGFDLRNSKSTIPNYFEPFLRENIDILFAYKSKKEDYIIFKGDSDQDRPNIIQ
jgi:hypothetical protein